MTKTIAQAGLAALLALLALTAFAAPQGGGQLAALARLQPGQWQLRDLEAPATPPRAICVTDPAVLIQLEHRGTPCSRLVITNAAGLATVHYTCAAGGFGRTAIRVETPRLAVVDTQGIAENAPFAYRFEARRVGACPRSR